jgi:hypothetical protein
MKLPAGSFPHVRHARRPNGRAPHTAQVQSAQHNLPANGKRQLLHTVHVPDAASPGAAFVSGLPVELPQMDMQSAAPSGQRRRGTQRATRPRLASK